MFRGQSPCYKRDRLANPKCHINEFMYECSRPATFLLGLYLFFITVANFFAVFRVIFIENEGLLNNLFTTPNMSCVSNKGDVQFLIWGCGSRNFFMDFFYGRSVVRGFCLYICFWLSERQRIDETTKFRKLKFYKGTRKKLIFHFMS